MLSSENWVINSGLFIFSELSEFFRFLELCGWIALELFTASLVDLKSLDDADGDIDSKLTDVNENWGGCEKSFINDKAISIISLSSPELESTSALFFHPLLAIIFFDSVIIYEILFEFGNVIE